MAAIRLLLVAVAFLCNVIVGLFLLVVVILSRGQDNIQLWAVPAQGAALTRALWIGSVYSLAATLLALRKSTWSRLPMLLWNIAVPVAVGWAVTKSGFSFESRGHALTALYLFLAALVTLWGAWVHLRDAGGRS